MRRRLALAGFSLALTAAGCLIAVPASAAPAVATTTTLSASPNPTPPGAQVTLTAVTVDADGTQPAGSVQFEAGGTNIGSPVTVNFAGVATTTTTFTAAGPESLSAVFTPSSSSYNPSTGNDTETVAAAGGAVPLTITVPPSGAFTLTVTPGTVDLTTVGTTASGTLEDITVTDTRNTYPGWSVSGQDSAFTGSGSAVGSTISGNQLGWAPIAVQPPQGGATLGGTVAPVSPGLGTTPATLALAPPGCGFGTNVLSANLTLAIPSTAAAGPYASTMTITAVTTGPQDEVCVPVTITV
jgi:Big-like domain-containing protein